ncbi:hypothetical protein AB4Z50_24035 [Paenibacillus sp. 2TAB26]
MDLSGQEALYKVGVLLILGAISFFITWINSKWRVKNGEINGKGEEAVTES